MVVAGGGLRVGFEGAQDYDLALRMSEVARQIVHIPHVLYHWRILEGSTSLDPNEKGYAHKKAVAAIEDTMKRRGLRGEVRETAMDVYHRIAYQIDDPAPLVTIIIPTRDHVELLKTILNGLLYKTDYQPLEILVIDNESREKETLEFFAGLEDTRVSIIQYPGVFNYSAMNNFA